MIWAAISAVFGGALSQVIVVYNILKNIPMFWKLVQNFDVVKGIWTDAEKIAVNLFEEGHPTSENVALSLDLVARAFDSGLIDLPNLDEVAFAKMLHDIQNNIQAQLVKNLPGGKNE